MRERARDRDNRERDQAGILFDEDTTTMKKICVLDLLKTTQNV